MNVIDANGAKIPAIGLGTWELRGRTCARLVEQALRLGYRHIDTAQVYENEREVGEGLRASGIPRDELFVTTKVWTTHFAPNDLERSTKESLSKLHLSEVDLLLLHWPNPRVPLRETLGALAHVKQIGLTRHIGVSNFTVALIEEAVAACPEPLACDQVEFHPYLDQTKVREACARNGMAVVAYSPVAKGRRDLGPDRAELRQDRRPGGPALAGATERRCDPADLADRAAVGKYRHFRLCAVGSGDGPALRNGKRQGAADQFRFRAGMGLRYAAGGQGRHQNVDRIPCKRSRSYVPESRHRRSPICRSWRL
jgi:diketogulonate reductase-like aldo/keto reductase